MTAEEIYNCDQPRPVGDYYNELIAYGARGELACNLLRAQKNCDRIPRYDEEKYLNWIRGRREWAVIQIMTFPAHMLEETNFTIMRVNKPSGLEILIWETRERTIKFTNHHTEGWKASPGNKEIIFQLCDSVMKGKYGTA